MGAMGGVCPGNLPAPCEVSRGQPRRGNRTFESPSDRHHAEHRRDEDPGGVHIALGHCRRPCFQPPEVPLSIGSPFGAGSILRQSLPLPRRAGYDRHHRRPCDGRHRAWGPKQRTEAWNSRCATRRPELARVRFGSESGRHSRQGALPKYADSVAKVRGNRPASKNGQLSNRGDRVFESLLRHGAWT